MNVFFKRIIPIVVMFVVPVSGFAQTSEGSTLNLTLKEAQEHALLHNKNVKNAGLSVSEAQQKVWETIANGLPQVNATLDYQNMMGFKASLGGLITFPLTPTSTFQASVTQLLFSGSYWVGIKMSKIGQEVSETMKLQQELEIKQQVRTAYLGVLVAEENKAILEKTLKDVEIIAKTTADALKVGVAEETDVDQIKVQVASVMNNIKAIERGIELSYNLLRFHLGLSPETELALTQTLDALMNAEAVRATLNTEYNMEDDYNIRLLNNQLDLANHQIRMEQTTALPTVAMFYNYTYKLKASTFDMSPNNIIGLQASIPIFASGQRHSKIQQAKIRLETAQNSKDLVSEQLLLQEKQLRFNLNNALETYDLQKEALEVSQRVFASITRKYNQGVVSSLDVTTANTSLLQAQGNYIAAMNSVISAQTELEKLFNTL